MNVELSEAEMKRLLVAVNHYKKYARDRGYDAEHGYDELAVKLSNHDGWDE